MACVSSSAKARHLARATKYEAMLDKAYLYFDYLMGTEGTESFKFDSGEANSWAKYTKPDEFLKGVIRPLEAAIDSLRNAYNGTGVVRLNQSRGR